MPVNRKVRVHTVTVQESIKGAWAHSVEVRLVRVTDVLLWLKESAKSDTDEIAFERLPYNIFKKNKKSLLKLPMLLLRIFNWLR